MSETITRQSLDGSLEDHVLAMLCYSSNAIAVAKRVTAEMFTTRAYKTIAGRVIPFVLEHQQPPAVTLADVLESELKRSETGNAVWQAVQQMEMLQPHLIESWVMQQLSTFIMTAQMRLAGATAFDHLHKGNVQEAAEAFHHASEAAADTTFVLESLDLDRLTAPPAREWIYGRLAPRGKASIIAADGGTGKTGWAIGVACCVAMGQPLLGEPVYRPGRAVYIGLEDDQDDAYRSLAAFQRHHQIDPAALVRRLVVKTDKLLVALKRGNTVVRAPIVRILVAELRRIEAVLLVVDAFAFTHDLDDENNNPLIAQVMAVWAEVARQADVAVVLMHHFNRTTNLSGLDRMRGASSIKNHARSCSVLEPVTDDEAKKLLLDEDERDDIIGLARQGKYNFMRNPSTTTWFRKIGINLNNGDHRSVMCLEVFKPQGLPAIAGQIQQDILAEIDAGCGEGERYTQHKTGTGKGERWVGKLFMRELSVSETMAAAYVADWLKRLICEGDYTSPSNRQRKKGLFVQSDLNC